MVSIMLRLPVDVIKKLDVEAQKRHRSRKNMAETLLIDILTEEKN